MFQLFGFEIIDKSGMGSEGVQFKIIEKPIYNWVLANPVLYEKPILNVKETFLWDPTPNQECSSYGLNQVFSKM
jgi:hypothetical protein